MSTKGTVPLAMFGVLAELMRSDDATAVAGDDFVIVMRRRGLPCTCWTSGLGALARRDRGYRYACQLRSRKMHAPRWAYPILQDRSSPLKGK